MIYSQGENMNLAVSAEEVLVMVGQLPCPLRTLDIDRLYCTLPEHGANSASGTYFVTVSVGI